MAAMTASTVPKELNVVMEYCCSTAEEGVRTAYVEFRGKSCVKFFCDTCFKNDLILFPSYERSRSGIEVIFNEGVVRAEDRLNGSRRHGGKSFERHVKCMGITLHNAKILDDNGTCTIVAICGLSDGRILVADIDNNKVKLFDQDYNFVSHCKVYKYIFDICQINSCDVAITQDDWGTNRHEIQFISVQNGKLVKTRTLKLTHDCQGIAHHEGTLYVTTRTALMKYTLKGTLLRKLYEDKGSIYRVWKCAVSPSGERIYIVNQEHHKLMTLSRDGTVLYTFTDPELERPMAVHTTPSGQLLVVGIKSVLQVDSEGKRKLVTLSTESGGAKRPLSVFYNSAKSSILIGQNCYSKLLERKVDLMKVPC